MDIFIESLSFFYFILVKVDFLFALKKLLYHGCIQINWLQNLLKFLFVTKKLWFIEAISPA